MINPRAQRRPHPGRRGRSAAGANPGRCTHLRLAARGRLRRPVRLRPVRRRRGAGTSSTSTAPTTSCTSPPRWWVSSSPCCRCAPPSATTRTPDRLLAEPGSASLERAAGPGSARLPQRAGSEHTRERRRRSRAAVVRRDPRGVRDGRRPGPAFPRCRPRARRPRPGGLPQRPGAQPAPALRRLDAAGATAPRPGTAAARAGDPRPDRGAADPRLAGYRLLALRDRPRTRPPAQT